MKRIGLLGCGAIGTQIAIAIDSGAITAKLTHIYDTNKANSEKLVTKLKEKPIIVENGYIQIPKGPGLGVEFDPKEFEKHLVN